MKADADRLLQATTNDIRRAAEHFSKSHATFPTLPQNHCHYGLFMLSGNTRRCFVRKGRSFLFFVRVLHIHGYLKIKEKTGKISRHFTLFHANVHM